MSFCEKCDTCSSCLKTGCKPVLSSAPVASPEPVALAAELKRLIGKEVNYPGTPRSAAWVAEVFAKIDALTAPIALSPPTVEPPSYKRSVEDLDQDCFK